VLGGIFTADWFCARSVVPLTSQLLHTYLTMLNWEGGKVLRVRPTMKDSVRLKLCSTNSERKKPNPNKEVMSSKSDVSNLISQFLRFTVSTCLCSFTPHRQTRLGFMLQPNKDNNSWLVKNSILLVSKQN
jgi:hypothetical protein